MAVVAQQRTGGGIAPACAALSVARANFYRRPHPKGTGPRRPGFVLRALLSDERTRVLALRNDDRFADRAPAQVYATLLDEGRFLCSIPPPCTGSFGRAGWFGTGATSGVTRATTSRNCWPRGRMRCGPGIARNSWVR